MKRRRIGHRRLPVDSIEYHLALVDHLVECRAQRSEREWLLVARHRGGGDNDAVVDRPAGQRAHKSNGGRRVGVGRARVIADVLAGGDVGHVFGDHHQAEVLGLAEARIDRLHHRRHDLAGSVRPDLLGAERLRDVVQIGVLD